MYTLQNVGCPRGTHAVALAGSKVRPGGITRPQLRLPGGHDGAAGFRRRRRFLSGLAVLLLAVAIGISACGSPSPISAGTPPGTYHVAITAKASEISHSAPFTLTVKSLF